MCMKPYGRGGYPHSCLWLGVASGSPEISASPSGEACEGTVGPAGDY